MTLQYRRYLILIVARVRSAYDLLQRHQLASERVGHVLFKYLHKPIFSREVRSHELLKQMLCSIRHIKLLSHSPLEKGKASQMDKSRPRVRRDIYKILLYTLRFCLQYSMNHESVKLD